MTHDERPPRLELEPTGPGPHDDCYVYVHNQGRRIHVGHVTYERDLPKQGGEGWKAVPLRESHHAYPAGIGTGRTAWEAAQAFVR